MDQKTFKSLLKYYLSCIDAEEAMSLQLRKNQENKSYIFLEIQETLFSKDAPQLEVSIIDSKQRKFIERKSPDTETLVDLQYGFPVFKDKKDMLSPLFFIEVETAFSDQNTLRVLPQIKTLSVNRMHFVQQYGAEETQRICEELEGEFGSFEARMKAAEEYIPSISQKCSNEWILQPILFRSNHGGANKNIRYDLTELLKDKRIEQINNTALKYLLDGCHEGEQSPPPLPILEIGALNDQQEQAVAKGLTEPLSVVTGPPGTGKTQVVTALLASAVYNNKTVLFASNNNMPVDGVYKRLEQCTGGVGNWLIRLGNQNKRRECHQTITSLLERVQTSDLSELSLEEDREIFSNLEENIAKTRASLKTAQAVQAEISKLHEKENNIVQEIPETWVQQFSEIDPIALEPSAWKKLKSHSRPGLWLCLRRKLFGLEKFVSIHNDYLTALCGDNEHFSEYEGWLLIEESWDESLQAAQMIVKYLRLHQNWVLCIRKRRHLEEKLTSYATASDLFALKEQKSKTSQNLFEKWWLENIRNSAQEATGAFKAYYKDIGDYSAGRHLRLKKSLNALKHFFPIWITTNQSVSAIMPPEEALFDLVVIDEAGQVVTESLE